MALSVASQASLLWHSPCQLAAVLASHARQLSVLAWGRNVEGQCGVEGDVPVVARPLPILELHGAPVSSIHAGLLNSAAVQHNEAYTWGDGSSGKLGHGSGDNLISPSRIEAFIGRSAITTAALGHHHTLFLDTDGGVWACGENKEGQCGLGLSLEALAGRYRNAYYESLRPAAATAYMSRQQASSDRYAQYLRAAGSSAEADAAAAGSAAPYVAEGWGSLTGMGSGSSSRSSRSHQQQQQQQQFGQLFDARKQRRQSAAAMGFDVSGSSSSSSSGASYGLAGGLFNRSNGSSSGGISSSGLWGGADLDAMLHSSRLFAGQIGLPARVASEQSAGIMGLSVDSSSSSNLDAKNSSDSSQQESIEGQRVVGASASKYFSLAVTEKGEVWAWGADYNGALGSESSWSSSPERVAAPISEALAAAGGAVAAAAGGTFSAALTAAGTVLVWGKLGGGSPNAPGLTAAAAVGMRADYSPSSSSSSSGMFAQVQLPEGVRISSIAAGQQHLLLSDGQRVWVVGRWIDAAGEEVGVASWDAPHMILSVHDQALSSDPSTKITKVVAGMHSSAAVASDGRLWVWGRLLDEQRGLSILKRFGGEKYAAGVDWSWAGFGGAEPRLVEGISGVRDVALGGWHAMVLVD